MAASRRIEPGPGQESVWDYPRPPGMEASRARVRVVHAGVTVADTTGALRILETSQPPAYYLPPDDVTTELLEPSTSRSFCEWKGTARYWDLVVGDARVPDAAWSYPDPTPTFAEVADRLAFYAQRLDECWVNGQRVDANPGGFYGGWITADIVGPFKGGPGTAGW